MILAGDIGGTKTNLGLFEEGGGTLRPLHLRSFPSNEYVGLEAILNDFAARAKAEGAGGATPHAACFGVAGPVVEGQCVTPNLPWIVHAKSVARALDLEAVTLLNDLEATAYGIAEVEPGELVSLNDGVFQRANAGLIAAGTGLGEAGLFWDGKRYVPSASEGGHADFAPRNPLEIGLLQFLLPKYGRVSVERVLSGPGLVNIYEYLRAAGYAEESPEVAARFHGRDPSGVISAAALAGECGLCLKALDMFTAVYGATAGNIALVLKATGGIYVGGGIAPKIVEKLKDGTFLGAFMDKGRLSPLLATIPVRVILNDKTALLGAARVAAQTPA